jgi:hydroxymethylbilane synthase
MALLRIGSRGSALALWQANHVAALLRERAHQLEIEIIKTTGDKVLDVALSQVGAQTGVTKGIFTKEIEEALAEGRVDLAVHSLKDLPTGLSPGFEIAAIPQREDVRDAFCAEKFASVTELPKKARVGTSSLRRQAQLKALRPDLETIPLRGNVDTRLRKLAAGEYDAIILAAAGLNRLGQAASIRELLPVDVMCPAAGQGALAIEIRSSDEATRSHVSFLDDPVARATTLCERALLDRLGGGCQVPIGASATLRDGRLHLHAVVASPDGKKILRQSGSRLMGSNDDAVKLGLSVGDVLLQAGAEALIRDLDPAAVIPVQAAP